RRWGPRGCRGPSAPPRRRRSWTTGAVRSRCTSLLLGLDVCAADLDRGRDSGSPGGSDDRPRGLGDMTLHADLAALHRTHDVGDRQHGVVDLGARHAAGEREGGRHAPRVAAGAYVARACTARVAVRLVGEHEHLATPARIDERDGHEPPPTKSWVSSCGSATSLLRSRGSPSSTSKPRTTKPQVNARTSSLPASCV